MNFKESFDQLIAKLTGWGEQLILLLPNILIALAVLVAFWFTAGFTKKLFLKLLNRMSSSRQVNWLAAVAVQVVVIVAGFVVALGIVGLDKTVTSLLAGAGLVGLAIALAFQNLGQNLLAGIYLALRRTVNVGDIIKTNDHFGTVREINLRSTHLNVPEGQIVVIPNKEVFESVLIKYSTGRRRVDLGVGVSYGDDLAKVKQVATDCLKDLPHRDQNRAVEFFYEEFGDSSINFVVRFWISFDKQKDFLGARSDAIQRIKKAFDQNGITIPFPIRTLDFGIVGGEKLSDVLDNSSAGKALAASNAHRSKTANEHDS